MGEADIVDTRPNLRVRVARLESMIERLVQNDAKCAAEPLGDLDQSMHARSDSLSPRKPSHGVMVKPTYTNSASPLSSIFDRRMVG